MKTILNLKSNVRSIMRNSIYLPMAAVLLTAAFAGAAVAAEEFVPFTGTLQAQETISPGPLPGTISADGTGGGIASHLGRFTLTWKFTVNLADGTGSGTVRY